MGRADEDSIRNAIQTVKSGVSVNKAATRWGVPRTTLMNRLKGKGSHQTGSEVLQRLSRQQEINLCGWAITETAAGNPPTQRRLCDMATKILVAKGDLRPLGRNWIDAFFRRNPELKLAAWAAEIKAQSPNAVPLTEPFPNGLFPLPQKPSDELVVDQVVGDQLMSDQLVSDHLQGDHLQGNDFHADQFPGDQFDSDDSPESMDP
ncbi:hypothetical protein NQ176_g10835 [Zarea fungicola]|uniref:Uncharacterized protein n=1 Tax=Zarea fungicola TaxID=93591 RepID=A0ACC1MDN7_9HYPO|nr:hypothetical protein NQ176_g10835 [Lecanicillium fungicola]